MKIGMSHLLVAIYNILEFKKKFIIKVRGSASSI